MFWKALFVVLVAACVGVMWQSEEYRRMLVTELELARDHINMFAARYDGWQVIFVTVGLTLIASNVLSWLFEESLLTFRQRATRSCFRLVRKIPGVGSKIKREVTKVVDSMEKKSFAHKPGETYRAELPKKGMSHDQVLKQVADLEKLGSVDCSEGWVSGALYYCSPELTKLCTAVFERSVWINPLHASLFPHIRKMEAEVIQWTVKLFNGGQDTCGVMTSGGTDSILMAMRAYREWGYERGIKYPEIVCPVSVHCAFNKAAEYFRMKLVGVSSSVSNLSFSFSCGTGEKESLYTLSAHTLISPCSKLDKQPNNSGVRVIHFVHTQTDRLSFSPCAPGRKLGECVVCLV